jgi:hypothetical protein
MSAEVPTPDVAGPQTEASVTSRPPSPSAPSVLDESHRALLKSVLNRLIPPRDDLPGAGDLDVGDSIERAMAGSPRLCRLLLDGLTEIAIASGGQPFVKLGGPRQIEVLEAVERNHPACFVALVEHAYRGYYTLPAVHAAIGHEGRPPQPLGHTLPPFDPALLDRQRVRLPFWRRVEPS